MQLDALIDITDMKDADLDKLLGLEKHCPSHCMSCRDRIAADRTPWPAAGCPPDLCVKCATARPDESWASWGDHNPLYDY